MTRQEFTLINSVLETEMREAGELWVNDWWMRSAEAQNALYRIGREQHPDGTWRITGSIVTNCDGYDKHSNHQAGCAVDKYFVKNGVIVYDCTKHPDIIEKYNKWHNRAVELGLKPMIIFKDGSCDYPHFEG